MWPSYDGGGDGGDGDDDDGDDGGGGDDDGGGDGDDGDATIRVHLILKINIYMRSKHWARITKNYTVVQQYEYLLHSDINRHSNII